MLAAITLSVLLPVALTLAAPAASRAIPLDNRPVHTVKFRVHIDKKRGGRVLCALYDNEDKWLSRDVFRSAQVAVSGSWATCVFKRVPKRRTYALTALHDEDGDGEMDTNLIGLPEEGYAASRNAHEKGIGAPDWDDAKFDYKGGIATLTSAMKY